MTKTKLQSKEIPNSLDAIDNDLYSLYSIMFNNIRIIIEYKKQIKDLLFKIISKHVKDLTIYTHDGELDSYNIITNNGNLFILFRYNYLELTYRNNKETSKYHEVNCYAFNYIDETIYLETSCKEIINSSNMHLRLYK